MAKNEDYQAPLRGVPALIARLLLQFVETFVKKINDPEQRMIVEGLVTASQQTVAVLSDTDPNDKEQLQDVINQLFRSGPFQSGSQAELMSKVNEITNENVRVMLNTAIVEGFKVGDLLTDSDSANSEQLEEYLRELLRSEIGITFLRALLGLLIKNSVYADTAASLIIQLLLASMQEDSSRNNRPLAEAGHLVEIGHVYQKRAIANS